MDGADCTVSYDADGQMIGLTSGSSTTTFVYGTLGRRVSRTPGGGTTTNFVLDRSGRTLLEMQGSTVTSSYLYGTKLVGQDGGVNLYDGQGSSRQTTNSSQSVTSSRTFEGFGQLVAGTASNYGYAATSVYRNDGDAGLQQVGARYCDAEVGRFVTRDTDLTQKAYTYCEGDPINATDPSGRSLTWTEGAAGSSEGVVVIGEAGLVSAYMLLGAAIVGFGVGYGIDQIPTGGGQTVGDRIGNSKPGEWLRRRWLRMRRP